VLSCADGREVNNYGRRIPYSAVFDTTTNESSELPNALRKRPKGTSSYGSVSGTDLVAASTHGPFLDAATDEWFDLPPLDADTDASSSDIDNQMLVTRRTASVGDAIVVVGGTKLGPDGGTKLGPDGGTLLAQAHMWTP